MTNDKELARKWAEKWTQPNVIGELGRSPLFDDCHAAARYILSTLADDRDARIEALTSDNAKLRKALQGVLDVFNGGSCERASADFCLNVPDSVRVVVERLTKERDEARRVAMPLGLTHFVGATTDWVGGIPFRITLANGAVFAMEPRSAGAFVTEKPAAEDAELDAAIKKMDGHGVADESIDWAIAVEEAIELLAARVKEMRRG